MKRLIVIGGPTASGKTAFAIKTARFFGTEIISADSRQFYREMSIGTAKPEAAELAAVKHHFINSLSIQDSYSVGAFERDCLALLERLFRQYDTVVMAGGSGLFIRAVCEGLDRFPDISAAVRGHVAVGEQTGGLAWLQNELARLDPAYFQMVDRNNPARLRRALEVCLEAGAPYSHFRSGRQNERFFESLYWLLDWPRETLYQRIDQRVDAMVAAGLEAEVRSLLPYRHLPALRTVGYEEWFEHFDGLLGRAETIEKIKQHTRNYAKRQMTWFRKHGTWHSVQPDTPIDSLIYVK